MIRACSLLCVQPSESGAARYAQLVLLSFIDGEERYTVAAAVYINVLVCMKE